MADIISSKKFTECAEYTTNPAKPHQAEAWAALHGSIDELYAIYRRCSGKHVFPHYPHPLAIDGAFFTTYQNPPEPSRPDWLPIASDFIKHWEGTNIVDGMHVSYLCPAGVWTIGYGSTFYGDGTPVGPNESITEATATQLFNDTLLHYGPRVIELLEAEDWAPEEQAACISWGYNVGLGAVENSTLRRRIVEDKEDYQTVVPEELPRWNKANGKYSQGLANRRAAEVDLFESATAGPITEPTPPPAVPDDLPTVSELKEAANGALLVGYPYFYQRDNALDAYGDPGWAQCASTVATMYCCEYRVPGIADNSNPEAAYNRVREKFGRTTDPQAHVQTLRSLGLDAYFSTTWTPEKLKAEIDAGRGVMAGWLHNGYYLNPINDGGHYSMVVGYVLDDAGQATTWTIHDPGGEADIVNGGFVKTGPTDGKYIDYSNERWCKCRWVDPAGVPNDTWAIGVRGRLS